MSVSAVRYPLLTCGVQRYVLKSTDIEHCFRDDSTILCPTNVLTTVKDPRWLGLPWTPDSKVQFKHTHQLLKHCKHLRNGLSLGGRYILSTALHNVTIMSGHTIHHLQLSPLSIIHIPCNMSFSFQHTGLGTCPQTLRFSILVFQHDQFLYIPWKDITSPRFSLAVPQIPIPRDFQLDNTTIQSLDRTYDSLDRDLTLRLAKFNHDVDQLSVTNDAGMADIFAYLSLALCVLNFLGLGYLLYRFRRFSVVLNYNQ